MRLILRIAALPLAGAAAALSCPGVALAQVTSEAPDVPGGSAPSSPEQTSHVRVQRSPSAQAPQRTREESRERVGRGVNLSHTGPRVPETPERRAPSPPALGLGTFAREDDGAAISVVGNANALQRVAGSATSISQREIQQTQPLTTPEMLRRVPGVTVRDEEGMGLRLNVSLRGLDPTRSRRVLLLEDGVPLGLNPYGEPDAYYAPPLDRMDRLEVVRGSGAIAYGPQTVGGVINFVTPAPPPVERASVTLTGGDRSLMGVNASYGNTVGPAGFVFQALHRRGDGFRNMNFAVTDLYGKVRLRLGPRAELTFRLNVYDEQSSSTYLGLTDYQFRTDPTQNAVPDDFFFVRRYSAAIIHLWRISPQVRLQTTVFGYITARNWHRQLYDRSPEPGARYQRIVGVQPDGPAMGQPYEPGSAIYLRNANRNNDRYYEVYGAESRLTANFRSGSFRHEAEVGVRALAERALLRVEFGDSPRARTGYLDSEEQHDGFALSAFAQDRVALTDRFSAYFGTRLERYSFSRDIRRVNNSPVMQRGANEVVVAIPGVSLSYAVVPQNPALPAVTVFTGAHVGYSPPRVTVAIDPNSTATSTVDAERSINLELGVRFRVGEWLRGEATLFNVNFLNEIIAGSLAGGTSGFAFINGGASRYLGAEGSIEWDFGRMMRFQESLYLQLRATGVDARQLTGDTAGNVVPYTVPITMGASVGFEHDRLPRGFVLGGQASWLYTAQQFTDRDNIPEGTPDGLRGPVPAYHNLDLTARVRHRGTGLGLNVSVKNVLNQIYIATRLPEGIFPGGFRQFMVSLRWDH